MPLQAFTARAPGRTNVLITPVTIFEAFDPATQQPGKGVEFSAIWDTGATNTVISQKVVDALALKPSGFAKVRHVGGEEIAECYSVNLMLPNHVGLTFLRVTKGKPGGGDVLIGMDIIGAGDFAVTNHGGKTTFTFRFPSFEEIDFVKKSPTSVGSRTPGRNDPCFCGSGRKYRKCHGKPG